MKDRQLPDGGRQVAEVDGIESLTSSPGSECVDALQPDAYHRRHSHIQQRFATISHSPPHILLLTVQICAQMLWPLPPAQVGAAPARHARAACRWRRRPDHAVDPLGRLRASARRSRTLAAGADGPPASWTTTTCPT